ncbi:TPR-like protein [Amylocystis lapponica]|nr:TPR-like protein [Amylocystis lapponica]
MSAFVKNKLKAARDAINKKEYEKAKGAATEVLEYEPGNYNANVFLALALLNLGQTEQSEQAYRTAIAASPEQVLAWQGLSRLYEQQKDWPKHAEVLQRLVDLFAKLNDATKCAETLQKFIELRRDPEKSTQMQLADALALLLPDSPLYPVLSTLSPPDPTNPDSTSTFAIQTAVHNSLPTLEELVALCEHEEETTIDREVAKRRTRLGASGPEQLQREVSREVLASSRLPNLYNEVLNHPNTSDELRRSTESRLLRHRQRYLYVLPAAGEAAAQKTKVAAELEDLVNGMVLLGVQDDLAWSLFIEAKDAGSIDMYGLDILRQLVELFPSLSLAKLVKGYFGYMGVPVSEDDEDSAAVGQAAGQQDDFVDVVIDAFGRLPDSLLAHLAMEEIYQHESDLENAIKVAESGLGLVKRTEQNNGKPMPKTKKAFNVSLATSLVQYFPPKHHPRALDMITQVLVQDPDNVPCLMGRAYVLQHARKWTEAGELFERVAQLLPDDLDQGLRAKEEQAWCRAMNHDLEGGANALQEVLAVLDAVEDREDDQARCWWRLGRCYWDMGDHSREEAYRHFITSLKRSPTFAPAFTSLGIYYSEFLSPADPSRASKCFQKAFELDPREAEAARRLSEGFAEEREWDLVEVVARRTIDGEGGLAGRSDAVASARYLPINAWAWKAVGVVELNRQNYPPAIQAFQIALRTDTDDQLSWLRLGEAYSKAGRYAAAVKALERALELKPDDWICSYFIGEVQRQMGDYEGAIKAFAMVLDNHPDELGVLLSLGQAHLDLGRSEFATAYTTRAEGSFVSSVLVTLRLIDTSPGFRRVAWKTAADAIYRLSQFPILSDEDSVRECLARVVSLLSDYSVEGMSGFISTPLSLDASSDISLFTLEVAIAAYDYRISLGSLDNTTHASAFFDLGAALSAYIQRGIPEAKAELARQSAISQLKEALRLDPSNDRYWDALANVTFSSQPRTAQHAFIKALEIASKNVVTWTNLGLFYLHHGDVELANEAFYKAQTLDPDYALAWVGQGLVATANGHETEATALFEHAVGLSVPVPDADLEYARRLFRRSSTSTQLQLPADALVPAFFVLDRFCKKRPQDASALHLLGLVCERIGHLELAVENIGRAIALLEAAYEDTEDPAIERQFTIAHSNMGRLRLALGDYNSALESFQATMGLLPEELESETPTTRILLAQAQFGSGLAQFKIGELAEALTLFEAALSTASDDAVVRGHAIVMLAQTLWALGTEEGRESAKTQLLQSIESDPDNLTAINTLAGMGILTDDDSLVDAALSEILSLPIDHRLARDPGRDVTYLLIQHHLAQGDATRALSVAQTAVFAEPSRADARRELAALTLQQGASGAARAVIAGSAPAREDGMAQLRESLALHATVLCRDGSGAEARRLAQKAVMLSPWRLREWQALGYCAERRALS